MTKTTPLQIIEAFDEILDFVYGRSRGRDYHGKEDLTYATQWVEYGLTVPIASAVFWQRMNIMHERWLRQHDHNDTTNIPRNPGLFDENIRAALARVRAGGEPIEVWEQSESLWKARIRAFLKDPDSWTLYIESWGNPPGQPGSRVSARLLAVVLAESKQKTAN